MGATPVGAIVETFEARRLCAVLTLANHSGVFFSGLTGGVLPEPTSLPLLPTILPYNDSTRGWGGPVKAAGTAPLRMAFQMYAQEPLDESTIVGNDHLLTSPGGDLRYAGAEQLPDGRRVFLYDAPAPGGSWDRGDNGVQPITIRLDQLRTATGHAFSGTTLAGSFFVDVPPPPTPLDRFNRDDDLRLTGAARVRRRPAFLFEMAFDAPRRGTFDVAVHFGGEILTGTAKLKGPRIEFQTRRENPRGRPTTLRGSGRLTPFGTFRGRWTSQFPAMDRPVTGVFQVAPGEWSTRPLT